MDRDGYRIVTSFRSQLAVAGSVGSGGSLGLPQLDTDDKAASLCAAQHRDRAAMAFGNLLDNRQAQSATVRRPARHPVEALQDQIAIRFGEAGTVILDLQPGPAGCGSGTEPHGHAAARSAI